MNKPTKMTLVHWDHGRRVVVHEAIQRTGVLVQVEIEDGRTAQMVFDPDGALRVRAWGNTPMLLGNGNKTAFRAVVPYEEPTTNEHGDRLEERERGGLDYAEQVLRAMEDIQRQGVASDWGTDEEREIFASYVGAQRGRVRKLKEGVS